MKRPHNPGIVQGSRAQTAKEIIVNWYFFRVFNLEIYVEFRGDRDSVFPIEFLRSSDTLEVWCWKVYVSFSVVGRSIVR